MDKLETLEQRAEGFLGREMPLCDAGLQSIESAVFSEVCKGFGILPGEIDKNQSAKMISSEGQTFFVPLEKVVDFFEQRSKKH